MVDGVYCVFQPTIVATIENAYWFLCHDFLNTTIQRLPTLYPTDEVKQLRGCCASYASL